LFCIFLGLSICGEEKEKNEHLYEKRYPY